MAFFKGYLIADYLICTECDIRLHHAVRIFQFFIADIASNHVLERLSGLFHLRAN